MLTLAKRGIYDNLVWNGAFLHKIWTIMAKKIIVKLEKYWPAKNNCGAVTHIRVNKIFWRWQIVPNSIKRADSTNMHNILLRLRRKNIFYFLKTISNVLTKSFFWKRNGHFARVFSVLKTYRTIKTRTRHNVKIILYERKPAQILNYKPKNVFSR